MGLLDRVRKAVTAPEPFAPASAGAASSALWGTPAEVESLYERQLVALQDVRRAVVDAMGARKRLEAQADHLQMAIDRAGSEAASAAVAGRDADARAALAEQVRLEHGLPDLEKLVAGLRAREEGLQASSADLRARITAFKAEKEALKTRAAVADLEASMGESLAAAAEHVQSTRDLLLLARDAESSDRAG